MNLVNEKKDISKQLKNNICTSNENIPFSTENIPLLTNNISLLSEEHNVADLLNELDNNSNNSSNINNSNNNCNTQIEPSLQIPTPQFSKIKNPIKDLKCLKNKSSLSNKIYYCSVILYLHGVVTVLILSTASTFLTYYQYFGDPISCLKDKYDSFSREDIERYCWMEGSYSAFSVDNNNKIVPFISEHIISRRKFLETYRPYPGIKTVTIGDKIVFHRNYAWIYFIILLQALMFYIPKYIWKTTEISHFKKLNNLNYTCDIESMSIAEKNSYAKHVANLMTKGNYLLRIYIMCEMLCLLNLYLQVFTTNIVLNGEFIQLGLKWYKHYSKYKTSRKYNPLTILFPRFVKCSVKSYGVSGSSVTEDALCVLNLNTINEKLFLILWIWYFSLFAVTVLTVFQRIYMFVPCIRSWFLVNCWPHNKGLNTLCRKKVGYFFTLKILNEKMNTCNFVEVIGTLLTTHFDSHGNFFPDVSFRKSYEEHEFQSDTDYNNFKPSYKILHESDEKINNEYFKEKDN